MEDLVFTVMMLTDDVAMTICDDLDESVDELIEMCNGDIDEIKNYLRNKYDIAGLFI